jgi:hypothetical protein
MQHNSRYLAYPKSIIDAEASRNENVEEISTVNANQKREFKERIFLKREIKS